MRGISIIRLSAGAVLLAGMAAVAQGPGPDPGGPGPGMGHGMGRGMGFGMHRPPMERALGMGEGRLYRFERNFQLGEQE